MRNICSSPEPLTALKARLAVLERRKDVGRCEVGEAVVDGVLVEAATTGVVHDLYAETAADGVALGAFGLGLAVRAACGRPIVWGYHEAVGQELGRPYGPGLGEMGLSPRDVLLVRARDIQTLLAVGEEALRTPAVGAVVLSAWGEAKALNLTASRRLALAAEASGRTMFLARIAAMPAPSAAQTRWSVRAAASRPMEGGAPGRPAFSIALLRRRGGGALRSEIVEWDCEQRSFRKPETLSGDLVSLAAQRPVAPSRRAA